MKELKKVDVNYELWEDGLPRTRQYADKEDAQKSMRELGFDCYKVVAKYEEYIEVIFGKITKVYDEEEENCMKEKVIDEVLDLLISNVASWTPQRQEEITSNEGMLSLYANDYTRNYIEDNHIDITEEDIKDCINSVINEFRI